MISMCACVLCICEVNICEMHICILLWYILLSIFCEVNVICNMHLGYIYI